MIAATMAMIAAGLKPSFLVEAVDTGGASGIDVDDTAWRAMSVMPDAENAVGAILRGLIRKTDFGLN